MRDVWANNCTYVLSRSGRLPDRKEENDGMSTRKFHQWITLCLTKKNKQKKKHTSSCILDSCKKTYLKIQNDLSALLSEVPFQ